MQLQIRQTAPTPPVTKPIGSPLINSTPKQQPLKTKTNPVCYYIGAYLRR